MESKKQRYQKKIGQQCGLIFVVVVISVPTTMAGVHAERLGQQENFVPVPPTIQTVLEAFTKDPQDATEDEERAVKFFYDMIVATLEPVVLSDAMCGKSIMEALDIKTNQMKVEQDRAAKLTGNAPKRGWAQRPNNWAMTMATAALFMDPESGASNTTTIVHNMTRKSPDVAKKRTKQFKKGSGDVRNVMYMNYHKKFLGIWLDNKNGKSEAAANIAAWDKHTGMTKVPKISDAEKRSMEMPDQPDHRSGSKKPKLEHEMEDQEMSRWFLGMIGNGQLVDMTSEGGGDSGDGDDDGYPMPSLTGGSSCGSSTGSPASASMMEERYTEGRDAKASVLLQEQHREVAGSDTAL